MWIEDEAFRNPTKPVGPFLSQEEAERRRDALAGRLCPIQAGAGAASFRLPSRQGRPEAHDSRVGRGRSHRHRGGGGIPIVKRPDRLYEGVEAVIDKDLSSSMLATQIGADIFVILTEVPKVYTGFNTPEQRAIDAITSEGLKALLDEGHFPPGSMGPKVEAVCGFLERGGQRAIITNPDSLSQALRGLGGTHIIGGC